MRVGIMFVLALGVMQGQGSNALVREARFPWTVVRDNLLKMAEKMPAEDYSFKPVPEVESFGQRMAHIAGANLSICLGVAGQPRGVAAPGSWFAKEALVALVKQSNAACDAVFDTLTDAGAMEKISSRLGGPFLPEPTRTKLATLNNMVRHSNGVYGYMCVYLRLKGIVPPSSAPE
jgi:hypothetical protein